MLLDIIDSKIPKPSPLVKKKKHHIKVFGKSVDNKTIEKISLNFLGI